MSGFETPMRALTIHGPWLGAIVLAGRPVEVRRQEPPRHLVDQRIALHCASRWTSADDAAAAALAEHGVDVEPAREWGRHIVATARITAWGRAEAAEVGPTHVKHTVTASSLRPPRPIADTALEMAFRQQRRWAWDGLPDELRGPRYLWLLRDVRPVAPIGPMRGQLGFWGLPTATVDALTTAGLRWRLRVAERLLDPLGRLLGEPRRNGWSLQWGERLRFDAATLRGEVRGAGLRRIDRADAGPWWVAGSPVEEVCHWLLCAAANALDAYGELADAIVAAANAVRRRQGMPESRSGAL